MYIQINPTKFLKTNSHRKLFFLIGFWGFEREAERENNLRLRVWACNRGFSLTICFDPGHTTNGFMQ